MNKNSLIFWDKRGHCITKTYCNFQNWKLCLLKLHSKKEEKNTLIFFLLREAMGFCIRIHIQHQLITRVSAKRWRLSGHSDKTSKCFKNTAWIKHNLLHIQILHFSNFWKPFKTAKKKNVVTYSTCPIPWTKTRNIYLHNIYTLH